jgi:hypothetical protein
MRKASLPDLISFLPFPSHSTSSVGRFFFRPLPLEMPPIASSFKAILRFLRGRTSSEYAESEVAILPLTLLLLQPALILPPSPKLPIAELDI